MIIAINAINALAGAGISTLANLLPKIIEHDKNNKYIVLLSTKQFELRNTIPSGIQIIEVKYLPVNPYFRVVFEQLILPFYILFYKVDLLYSMANMTVLFAPCKIVMTIENSNPFSKIPIKWSLNNRSKNSLIKFLSWIFVRRVDIIRFVSNDSLVKISEELNINPNKCVMISHGCDFKFSKINQLNKTNNFILTVSAILPHKNLDRLIKAFAILFDKYNYRGNLVIIGDILDYSYYKTLLKTASDFSVAGKVELTGKITYNELSAFYREADAFVFTSIEETFGLPLLEAMTAGVPVAASDCDLNPSLKNKCFNPFKEICGDAIRYFDPFDQNNIAEEVSKILFNDVLKKELIEKGLSRAALFSWDKTAISLINVFNKLN
ncbi:MAG: glycosyltransferase family 4 protein [Elusimicrobia bacterium]|nr:glycosyltransferase family 4 protein [Elusimicrobiota bacterium]